MAEESRVTDWLKSQGQLQYGPGIRLVVNVEQDLADYYRKLIPKWYPNNPQRYGAHISVVRKEMPSKMEFWDKYQNHTVEFEYSPVIDLDETYFWLNVRCSQLEQIRIELGLAPKPWWENLFHITIANRK